MAGNVHTETVFADAVAIPSPSERAAFLDQACGADPDLRAEVERLVADHFRAGDFLAQPIVQIAGPDIDPLPFECPGTQIGPCVLLEQLDEAQKRRALAYAQVNVRQYPQQARGLCGDRDPRGLHNIEEACSPRQVSTPRVQECMVGARVAFWFA